MDYSSTLRRGKGAAALALCLVMLGCAAPLPYARLPAEAVPPPANLDPGANADVSPEIAATRQAAASSPAGTAFGTLDGSYRGQGRILRNPGGTCETGMPVYGMQVSGNHVHFGSFNGTIQPNGSVEMDWGKNWVIGQFDGPHFTGRWIAPACSYALTLDRES